MQWLKTSDADFEASFARIVADRREADTDVARDVRNILDAVKSRGDDALVEFTAK